MLGLTEFNSVGVRNLRPKEDQWFTQDQHLDEMNLGVSSPVSQSLSPASQGEQASCIMGKKQNLFVPTRAHIAHNSGN